MKIFVVGYVALAGALVIVKEARKQLEARFTGRFLDGLVALQEALDTNALIENLAANHPRLVVYPLADSGILGGLWEIGQAREIGIRFSLLQIPMKQEIIEVTEQYRLNPYHLASAGSYLLLVDDDDREAKEAISALCDSSGLPWAVIGSTNDSGKIIDAGLGKRRYVDRPPIPALEKWYASRQDER